MLHVVVHLLVEVMQHLLEVTQLLPQPLEVMIETPIMVVRKVEWRTMMVTTERQPMVEVMLPKITEHTEMREVTMAKQAVMTPNLAVTITKTTGTTKDMAVKET